MGVVGDDRAKARNFKSIFSRLISFPNPWPERCLSTADERKMRRKGKARNTWALTGTRLCLDWINVSSRFLSASIVHLRFSVF
jgi:hypothetical protein